MNISDYAKLGQVYNACSITAGLCTGLSTTYTGLVVWNPYGSGVNLLVYDFCAAASAIPAGLSELMISVTGSVSQANPTSTTAATLLAAKVGASVLSKATPFTIATLPVVNVNYRVIPGSVTATAVTTPSYYAKIDGSLVVVPGTGYMVSFTTTALTAQYSTTWAEVPQF
jgi:uncharacterized Zn-binding protein involved in type VI secretion